jgi:hypothetical protein
MGAPATSTSGELLKGYRLAAGLTQEAPAGTRRRLPAIPSGRPDRACLVAGITSPARRC